MPWNCKQSWFESEIFLSVLFLAIRFVNDSPKQHCNAIMKRLVQNGGVFLALYAKKDIQSGTEIRLVNLSISIFSKKSSD